MNADPAIHVEVPKPLGAAKALHTVLLAGLWKGRVVQATFASKVMVASRQQNVYTIGGTCVMLMYNQNSKAL
jgi:hypothetical protein